MAPADHQTAPPVQSTSLDEAGVWSVLEQVLDPEVPVLSVVELGIVRGVALDPGGAVTVTVTPTYSGCPATEAIADAIVAALNAAGAEQVSIRQQLSPPWTTDWLAPQAHDKLRRYGIAPPAHLVAGTAGAVQPLLFHPRGIHCPRCGSASVEMLSAFGSTACKALYRCTACREPFELFKTI
ncbi:1,2-phenylacetyl-CoA epoxidase subunit PaaD [Piscinibacter sakaiensis]|uniref:1,2-phenylacetyl-CoA epoxidase subunit PaaD n=1 Tax=Piscinibacter sakaiensis TaxID=1547922 RepID=UPI003AAEB8F8